MRGRRLRAWTVGLGLAVTVVHFVTSIAAVMSDVAGAIGYVSRSGNGLARLDPLLEFPVVPLVYALVPHHWAATNAVFFGSMAANSALWGSAIALLWRWWRLKRP